MAMWQDFDVSCYCPFVRHRNRPEEAPEVVCRVTNEPRQSDPKIQDVLVTGEWVTSAPPLLYAAAPLHLCPRIHPALPRLN